jgi:hypothetical protein
MVPPEVFASHEVPEPILYFRQLFDNNVVLCR